MEISIVIPIYNEESVIEKNISELKSYLAGNFSTYEIIAVNDGSTDKTSEILNSIPDICVIESKTNFGKGYAVKEGVKNARGDIVVFTDADLCYGTKNISLFCNALKTNDIAIGRRSKKRTEYSQVRKIYSLVFEKICAVLLKKDLDIQCGIKGFTKNAAERIFPNIKTVGFAFDFEILYICVKNSLKIAELPVTMKKSEKSSVRILKDPLTMLADVTKIVFRHFTEHNEGDAANEKTTV